MKKLLILIAVSLWSFYSFGQCTTDGTESPLQVVLVPTTSNQTTATTDGIGPRSERIYDGFNPNNSYTLSVSNPTSLSCRQGIFVNSANVELGSWFDLSSSTTIASSPANTAKLKVQTSRGSWTGTSATLTYRANTTVTTPVSITGTITPETCPGDNDGAISSVAINDALGSGVQYIKLIQRRTSDNHINLRELQAFDIFTGTNVALGATVTGKFGALGGYPFSNLTDNDFGNTTSGMAHTGTAAFGTWMQVDLGSEYNLDYVRIFNRTNCCTVRANNLLIEYYDGSYNLLYSAGINASAASSDYNVLDVTWSDGGSTLNRTGLGAGTYTLNYSDVAGNSGSQGFVVGNTNTVSVIPTSLTSSSTQICSGSSATLTINGGSLGTGAVTWDVYSGSCGGTLVGSTAGTTLSVSPTTTTTYYVRASGTCNTTGCRSVTINVAPAISITSSITDENCPADNDGEIDITISGGLSNVQYIRIEQLEANVINLTEVLASEIFTGTNVALGATVTQSSNHPCCTPSNLTDGVLTNFAHTNGSTGDWMRIDLGAAYNLDDIVIHNRFDCCWDRSDNLRLELYDVSNTLIYSENIDVYQSINAANSETFNVLDVTWNDAGTTLDRTALDAATYTLNYSDVGGCTDTEVAIVGTVNTNSTAAATATASPTFVCSGDAVTLSLTGGSLGTGATWEWYRDAGLTANVGSGTSITVNPIANTTYYVRAEGTCNTTPDVNTVEVIVNGGSTPPSGATLVSSTTSSTCNVSGTNWHYFYNSSGDLLAGINSNGNNLGSVTVDITVGDAGPFGIGNAPGVCGATGASGGEYTMARYWDISVTTQPSSDVDVRFYYTGAELTAFESLVDAQTVAYRDCWGDVNGEADLMMTVDHGLGSYEMFPSLTGDVIAGPGTDIREYQFAIDEFSGGKLHANGGIQGANPLPVELLTWEARAKDNEFIELTWSTATEINNDGFEIERSIDGVNFTRIAWAEGNGNSTEIQNYNYEDREVSKGVRYYYRLKQIDNDGTTETFEVVSAILTGKDQSVIGNLIPNPSRGNNLVRVNIESASSELMRVNIYNHVGFKVAGYIENLSEGINKLEINVNDLSSGTYFVNFEGNYGTQTRKLVLIK